MKLGTNHGNHNKTEPHAKSHLFRPSRSQTTAMSPPKSPPVGVKDAAHSVNHATRGRAWRQPHAITGANQAATANDHWPCRRRSMTKGLATAHAIAAAAAHGLNCVRWHAHRPATHAEALAAARIKTRASHAPPNRASTPSCGALRAGRSPAPKAEALRAGLSISTMSRHRNSPGSTKGQHTASTSTTPHAPRAARIAREARDVVTDIYALWAA